MGRHGRSNDRPGGRPKHSKGRGGWALEALSAVPMGPGIESASLEQVLAALQRFRGGITWQDAKDLVIPLFQRVRPYPSEFPEPVRHLLGDGTSVTFGVDTGPAFVHVSPDLLADWDRSISDVAEHALANLRRLARGVDPQIVVNDHIADLPVSVLQSGTGCASTFVLVPEELPRIFGHDRALFIAPMRDLLIALPWDADPEFASWLHAEFSAPDPNFLAPLGFRLAAGTVRVEALDAPAAIA